MIICLEEFLTSGSIVSLPQHRLLIAWGEKSQTTASGINPDQPAFYVNEFFLTSPTPWIQYARWQDLSFDEFEEQLGVVCVEPCEWTLDHQADFKQAFDDLLQLFCQGRLKKAVPYLFTRSTHSMTPERLKNSLKQAIKSLRQVEGYLYGHWDSTFGVLGVTPELLFSYSMQRADYVHTIAIAGTCRSNHSQEAFLVNEKERYEHQLVVQGICQALQELGSIDVGITQILKLPQLSHLMTPLGLNLKQRFCFETLVDALHPTPALGAYPKQEGKKWLENYQQLVPRHYYGAPLGFHYPQTGLTQCVVGIRNVQWNTSGMRIGAGCGVVRGSTYLQELQEVQLKMKAIQSLLALSEHADIQLAKQVLQALIEKGVSEFCVCPSTRNALFVYPLAHAANVRLYYWSEERSAAFFALGRIKATGRPVAVVTTSGSAVAELLPAVMEAHYTGLPLVLLTADRPRRFRGTGAPQSAEQVGIFTTYVQEMQDLAGHENCQLDRWNYQGPLHLNVCFEEPKDQMCQAIRLENGQSVEKIIDRSTFLPQKSSLIDYQRFLEQVRFPLVVIGALPSSYREEAVRFLLHLNAPLYAEGPSGLREDSRLRHLRLTNSDYLWSLSAQQGYPIDGILRLGGVPTTRLWRDLEEKARQIQVCSISEQPYAGLSCAGVVHANLLSFFEWAQHLMISFPYPYENWLKADQCLQQKLLTLFQEEPTAEPSLIYQLSQQIPRGSKIYLGNSLPIREWDLAATHEERGFQLAVSRGVNGIDGQLSTFLGYSSPEQDNWALIGDLTALYDLVAPWISSQLPDLTARVVVINNGGGKIFKRMFAHPAFQNTHQLSFEPLASFWGWHYENWKAIPETISASPGYHLIELVPDAEATERFWKRLKDL